MLHSLHNTRCSRMLRPSAQPAVARCRHSRPSIHAAAASRRTCIRRKTAPDIRCSAQQSDEVVHVLPKPEPVSKIFAAQAAAEAAHRELMSSGRLAEAAADNELLMNILETYSTVQRLYHQALQPFLEAHATYAGSAAGKVSPAQLAGSLYRVVQWHQSFPDTALQLHA